MTTPSEPDETTAQPPTGWNHPPSFLADQRRPARIEYIPPPAAYTPDAPTGETDMHQHPPSSGPVYSGRFSLAYNTHLISSGYDVWKGGNNWHRRTIGTLNPLLGIVASLPGFSVYAGAWADINRNANSEEFGGNVQEIDGWLGIGTQVGTAEVGVTYQQFHYASPAEEVIDLWIYDNDRQHPLVGIPIYPGLLIRGRVAGSQWPTGLSAVLSATPSFHWPITASLSSTLTLPLSIGFQEAGYRGGKSGFSYVSTGPQFRLPIASESLGTWTFAIGFRYFYTREAAIPGNPDTHFTTANTRLTLSF